LFGGRATLAIVPGLLATQEHPAAVQQEHAVLLVVLAQQIAKVAVELVVILDAQYGAARDSPGEKRRYLEISSTYAIIWSVTTQSRHLDSVSRTNFSILQSINWLNYCNCEIVREKL